MEVNAYHPISDYGLIGNCRSAALVSKYGSIDWCCMPEFHSPSIFTALLDNEKGGFFSVHPIGHFTAAQQYVPGTNVIETVFTCEDGIVKLTDCFVAMEEDEKEAVLFPDHEILRMAECVSGSVKMKLEYYPRAYYGKDALKLKDYKKLGVHFFYKENILVLQSTLEDLRVDDKKEKVETEFLIKEGKQVIFSLSCSTQHPAIISEVKTTATKRLEQTIAYWRSWIGHCEYDGVFKDEVLRSALTLKLLTHAP